jgi:hypothetical protein
MVLIAPLLIEPAFGYFAGVPYCGFHSLKALPLNTDDLHQRTRVSLQVARFTKLPSVNGTVLLTRELQTGIQDNRTVAGTLLFYSRTNA